MTYMSFGDIDIGEGVTLKDTMPMTMASDKDKGNGYGNDETLGALDDKDIIYGYDNDTCQ